MAAAKFTFIGNPRNPSDQRGELSFRGITFRRGEAVEVKDGAIAEKLRGNPHFVEEGKGGPDDKRTEVARANERPIDPRETVVPTYRNIDNPRAAVEQGAGESGFGYNKEADEADRDLAAQVRQEEREKRGPGRPPKPKAPDAK